MFVGIIHFDFCQKYPFLGYSKLEEVVITEYMFVLSQSDRLFTIESILTKIKPVFSKIISVRIVVCENQLLFRPTLIILTYKKLLENANTICVKIGFGATIRYKTYPLKICHSHVFI